MTVLVTLNDQVQFFDEEIYSVLIYPELGITG